MKSTQCTLYIKLLNTGEFPFLSGPGADAWCLSSPLCRMAACTELPRVGRNAGILGKMRTKYSFFPSPPLVDIVIALKFPGRHSKGHVISLLSQN